MNTISNYPLVSAIITTHNRCDLLDRAVLSVQAQTYTNIEIVVVDDGSTDGTYNKYSKRDDLAYYYIKPEQSGGGNYARNLGIKKSKGLYCAFLDDDDYWLPSKISKQVALLENGCCILVHGGFVVDKVDSNQQIERLPNPYNKGNMQKRILYNICCMTSNIIVKRDALFQVGLFDEQLHFWQEYELTIRLAQVGLFDFVNEPLMVYRINTKDQHRLTNKFFDWEKAVSYVYEKHKDLFNQLSFVEHIKVNLLRWQDAAIRAKASGLYIHSLFYSAIRKVVLVPFNIKSLLCR